MAHRQPPRHTTAKKSTAQWWWDERTQKQPVHCRSCSPIDMVHFGTVNLKKIDTPNERTMNTIRTGWGGQLRQKNIGKNIQVFVGKKCRKYVYWAWMRSNEQKCPKKGVYNCAIRVPVYTIKTLLPIFWPFAFVFVGLFLHCLSFRLLLGRLACIIRAPPEYYVKNTHARTNVIRSTSEARRREQKTTRGNSNNNNDKK